MEDTLDSIIINRPEREENLCLDAGYVGSEDMVKNKGYIPHIRPRGEEKKELERNPQFHAKRWVVEVTHSFFNRFRKLLVRFEKKAKKLFRTIVFCLCNNCLEKNYQCSQII